MHLRQGRRARINYVHHVGNYNLETVNEYKYFGKNDLTLNSEMQGWALGSMKKVNSKRVCFKSFEN